MSSRHLLLLAEQLDALLHGATQSLLSFSHICRIHTGRHYHAAIGHIIRALV